MNELVAMLRGTVTFDPQTFAGLRDRRDAMKRGVLLLLAIFFIAGSPQFVVDLAKNLRPSTETEAAEFQQQFMQGLETWRQFMPQQDEFSQIFMEQFMQNFEAGMNMGLQIANLPTPLPRGVGRFLETLGGWLSKPFKHLGAWLAYSIWVLLFARLLGGQGGVDRFLGATALYAVPNLLGFLRPIPYVGGLLALAGMLWGWAVYIRGVQISQRFDLGKAILVTVLPVLLAIVVGIIILVLVILSATLAAA